MSIIEDIASHKTAKVDTTTNITTSTPVLGVHDPAAYAISYPTLGAATLLTLSGTTAATGSALAAGRYLLVSTVDVCWEQAASPTAEWLAGDSKFLPAGVLLPCTLAAQKIAGITGGTAGTLLCIPVS